MNPEARRILVLDPEEESGGEALRELGRDGFQVTAVLTLKRALALMARQEYDLVVVALGVAGLTTRKLLGRIRESAPRVPLLALVQSGRTEQAVRALKGGAEDYLTKPVDPYDLKSRVGRILERRDLADRLTHLQTALTQRYALTSIVQHSPAMKGVVQRISQVAPASSTVLILGESGVGKELVAKAIHFNSPRRHRPFLAINCSAIPANLIESELFGHERGAFTGAVERVRGKFEMAEGGTIFLDEVGEMDPQTQVKLLRVMEEREFMRLGGSRNIRIDVRVLAATNASLQQKIRQGKFREDLYFRLQVITLQVPPLRERAADLPELVRFFLDSLSRTNSVPIPEIAPEVLFLFRGYSWPGNVRELKNLLESLVVTLPGQRIEAADLPPAIRGEQALEAIFPNVQAGMTLREMERELIQKTLANTDGNRTRAARILEIGVRTLQRKIREYGLH
jgi:DNA-binding NtrC family response regulator